MGFANDIIGGAAALIRAAIKSPNYRPGTAGWIINKDGSAEFNSVLVRGAVTVSGTTFAAGTTGVTIDPAVGTIYYTSAGGERWLLPSAATDGAANAAAINAAVQALPAAGGVVHLAAAGPWYIQCGQVTVNRSGVTIDAAGCVIYAVGAGDMIRMYDSSAYSGRLSDGGGLVGGPVIDGSNTTGPSCPFHAGDIPRLRAFYRARKFLQPSSPAAWFDNAYYWTEQIQGTVSYQACTGGVVFDHSAGAAGSTGSFERMSLEVQMDNTGVGDGVTFKGGAFTLDHRLDVRGNFSTSPPATGPFAVLRLTGGDSSGQQSTILAGQLNIGVELGDLTAGNVVPQTIAFGGPGNLVWNTLGVIDFSANQAFAPSNNSGQFRHFGPVLGDAKLASSDVSTPPINQTLTGSGQTIFTRYAQTTVVGSTGAYTGTVLDSGAYPGQEITVINASASAITFAASPGSHLAAGSAAPIAAGAAARYTWEATGQLWYRV